MPLFNPEVPYGIKEVLLQTPVICFTTVPVTELVRIYALQATDSELFHLVILGVIVTLFPVTRAWNVPATATASVVKSI